MNSKAEADSCRVEIELKNEQLSKLRQQLNISQADYQKVLVERDQLQQACHLKEEVDAKVSCCSSVR